jgi:hypothetical protein
MKVKNVSPGKPHFNKKTQEAIPTSRLQSKDIPGGARTPAPWEIPDNKRFKTTPTGS